MAQRDNFMMLVACCALLVVVRAAAATSNEQRATSISPTTQLAIDRVDLMPNRPEPFKLSDSPRTRGERECPRAKRGRWPQTQTPPGG